MSASWGPSGSSRGAPRAPPRPRRASWDARPPACRRRRNLRGACAAAAATAATAATPSSSTPDGPADEAVFLRLLRDEGLSDCALISPATSKGLVMTCSDGLTVSRYESALAKLRDAVIDGAGSKEEANIVLKQLSLFLTCNVVEHDRLHAVFHLTHLTLKHGFEHLGRAVARARGLTGVTTSSAEAGQNVRKKVHHERIQCLAAVKELVSAMLRDDAFRSRVDALPVEGGTIKQADFVALLVAFLTSGDGGSEFECVRDHALLAMNLHAFKTSLQWRHWLFANVAETISTPAMLANNKPNYGILFLELPFLSRMRSLAQSLGFWRSAMTVTTRGVEKSGKPSGEVHEGIVQASQQRLGSQNFGSTTRLHEGRAETNRGLTGSAAGDFAKMKAATAVAGLGAAVLHGYHRSLELRRERRGDFGGVAVKKEVAAVAALFRDARSCERRPDRAALLSHLEMTQSSYGVALGGDKLAVALASLRFEPSNRATTSGQPRFVSTCVAALSLNVAPDAVLVAAEVKTSGATSPTFMLFEPIDEPATLADILGGADDPRARPEELRLLVYAPAGPPKPLKSSNLHVNVRGDGGPMSAWELQLARSLSTDTSSRADRLEADDEDPDGYGAPCASPLDHVAVSPPAPVTQRPVGTAFQLELARDSCEAPPTALATRRAARRAGSDAHLAKALGMAQEGPNALLVAASAAISDATAPAASGAGDETDRATMRRAETLLRRQKSALVAERDGAAAEHAHLCQEKVRVLKSSTAKMQDLKATIKQCNAALRKNQKDSNVVQARRKAAELQDRLRAATAAEPEADGAVERDPDDEIRITDGEPVFSDADDSDGDFDDA
mmetsp:Transcript_17970/g.62153  ORF Transcript_17970/g.62153 Transcript_17970/m.62153 type:complete len:845 (+) Transcript_17970:1341-3875(+)